MSSLSLHPIAEDLFLEDSSRSLSPSHAPQVPAAEVTNPVPPRKYAPPPAEVAESLRVAIESYHLSRFGNHTDPGLEPLADHCAGLAAHRDLPLEARITLQQAGYEQVSVKVHAYRISEASSMAQVFRDQTMEYLNAAYNYGSSQAVGLNRDRWFLYIAVLTAHSLTG